jgi:NIPSNAP
MGWDVQSSFKKLIWLLLECRLPHKLAADSVGKPVMFCYTEIGTLNTVMELWRYPNSQACVDARQAARKSKEWQACIAEIQPLVQRFASTMMYSSAMCSAVARLYISRIHQP